MKKLISLIMVFLFISACSADKKENKKLPAGVHKVTVTQVNDAAGYSYMKVKENNQEYWIATNQMKVKKGDVIYFSQTLLMKNFHSKTLNKTFDKILFVQDATKNPAVFAIKNMPPIVIDRSPQAKLEGKKFAGKFTVAQIYKKKKELAGKVVEVSGKVVKFNPNIMGRNWVHITDGTKFKGKNDLLITTDEMVQKGDKVSFKGVVVPGKDFGAGYAYEVLLESGKLIKK